MPSAARRSDDPDRWLPWLDRVPDNERDEDATDLRGTVAHFSVTGEEDRCELLITHNLVIGWFVSQVLQTPVYGWIGLNSANCGLTIIKWDSSEAPEVLTFNDTGHLRRW